MPTTLDKPAGLTVFPPHFDRDGDCLLQRLLRDQPWRKEITWPSGYEGGIAHRLDNSTSGAVLAADSLAELELFRGWFAEHRFRKTYLMLAAYEVPWRQHRCELPIAHHPRKKNRMVVQADAQTPHRGKWYPACSSFQHRHGRLWEVVIATGIMHQIRAHAGHLGIPILGDRLYGGTPRELFPTGVSPQMRFYLHHVGMAGPENFHTDTLPLPPWARVGLCLSELLAEANEEPAEVPDIADISEQDRADAGAESES